MARPLKKSVTLSGHRTSVTIETEFWDALKGIAEDRHQSINQLIAEIDHKRMASASDVDSGLSSAIRVFVLCVLQQEK